MSKLQSVTEKALEAFWEAVDQQYPECSDGELDDDMAEILEETARAAIETWIKDNSAIKDVS